MIFTPMYSIPDRGWCAGSRRPAGYTQSAGRSSLWRGSACQKSHQSSAHKSESSLAAGWLVGCDKWRSFSPALDTWCALRENGIYEWNSNWTTKILCRQTYISSCCWLVHPLIFATTWAWSFSETGDLLSLELTDMAVRNRKSIRLYECKTSRWSERLE